MNPKSEIRQHFVSSVLPALIYGALAGVAAGVTVTLYKFCAKGAVSLSGRLYEILSRGAVHFVIPLVLAGVLALFLSWVYQKEPELKGGGIPTSVGALRGLFAIHPARSAVGSFCLSLFAFLFGVPLGTEGPSVQLGTALGAGIAKAGPRRLRAWERFSMTGGASAGFAVATGAPVSGVFFAMEEAHGRISPLITLTSVTSIFSSLLVSHLLSPLLGVKVGLFDLAPFPALDTKELWIPLVTGLGLGLFSLLFLHFYQGLAALFRKAARLPAALLIFAVVSLSLVAGAFSPAFVSTGHGLLESLFEAPPALLFLLAILLVRSFLTLSANLSGITGGIFLPLLAIGGTFGALLYRALGVRASLLPLFLVFGITGCIAGMMKMPLTAVLFGMEALGLSRNPVALVLCATCAFAIPAAFGADSVGERVLDRRIEAQRHGKIKTETEFSITLEENAFAVGKEIRDIFWPDGVHVLAVRPQGPPHTLLQGGDTLLIRLAAYNEADARGALDAICKH